MPKDLVAALFRNPPPGRARWQLVNSVLPYVLLWIAMVYALAIFLLADAPLAVVAAGFSGHEYSLFFMTAGIRPFFNFPKGQQCHRRNHRSCSISLPYRHWRWQTCLASWFLGQFGQERHRRYLDLDGLRNTAPRLAGGGLSLSPGTKIR